MSSKTFSVPQDDSSRDDSTPPSNAEYSRSSEEDGDDTEDEGENKDPSFSQVGPRKRVSRENSPNLPRKDITPIKVDLRPKAIPFNHTTMVSKANQDLEEARLLTTHMALLKTGSKLQDTQEVSGAPIFTPLVQRHAPEQFTQYGFFAGISKHLEETPAIDIVSKSAGLSFDPRLYLNIAAPSSAFICGSQGSGKSHTLSCLLENCLMKSDISKLDHPLAGLVFHYDTFTSDLKGTPCEAAYLASNPAIKVRILCSPTNLQTIKVHPLSSALSGFRVLILM
jgi:hypothetical protein